MTSLPNYALKGLLNLSLTHTDLYPELQATSFLYLFI